MLFGKIKKKTIYLLMLLVITLFGFAITGTYAMFTKSYTSTNDVVGLNLAFQLNISNIEEYDEINVDANAYQIFNVQVQNNTGATAYYGIWYKMVNPSEINDNIVIARLSGTTVSTSGSVANGSHILATIIVQNNTNTPIKINVGVASSNTSVSSIEYLDGKTLISGTAVDADYYYDESSQKYISTTDSTISFTTNSQVYSYTGASQTFTSSHDGAYKLEAWGAQGGTTTGLDSSYPGNTGGKGGYTAGTIDLKRSSSVYVYVGKQGGTSTQTSDTSTRGYNGGGFGGYEAACEGICIKQAGGGGGATDFRLSSGAWDNSSSLASRIMVAGGGGGAANWTEAKAGGAAGGLNGTNGDHHANTGAGSYTDSVGGSQTSGGAAGVGISNQPAVSGKFGVGGDSAAVYGGGGGGGYYGGGGGGINAGVVGSGAGGSSYISGYQGSVAITSSSNTNPKSGCTDGTTDVTCSYHYSGKKFIHTVMYDGNTSMPKVDSSINTAGNEGDGHARVTPVVPTIELTSSIIKGTKLDANKITCNDNGSGCQIFNFPDTSSLDNGTYNINISVKDDFGYIYRYTKSIVVTDYFNLNTVNQGAYVKYIGNNGCTGKSCEGQNANYVSDSDMGYCNKTTDKFTVNGWRVAYVSNGTAYLVSAASPECLCTNSDGTTSNNSCASALSPFSDPATHISNLNTASLKYCNSAFVYNGTCNSAAAWNFNNEDYGKMMNKTLNSCLNLGGKVECGYQNNLVNNGGSYWAANSLQSNSRYYTYLWAPFYWESIGKGYFGGTETSYLGGIRPILRLKASVVVTGGTGTYQDPYIISAIAPNSKLSDATAGSYVKYTGNNGCSGKACEGQNANYVNSSNMGYCYSSDYKFNTSGWRIAYVSDGTAYLTSAGSPECVEGSDALNEIASKYCNNNYLYNDICDESSAWNMGGADFTTILGVDSSTFQPDVNLSGATDIINNGSYYRFANGYFYDAQESIGSGLSNASMGIRPVLRLKASVKITGGSGTMDDPYTISPS